MCYIVFVMEAAMEKDTLLTVGEVARYMHVVT